jgi:MFS family permease
LILAGATVMLHLGRSIALLVLARILQGASAAVVWVVGLSMVSDTVRTEDVGRAMGYVFTAMSLGILLGPILGGVVFDKGGYDAVFVMAYVLVGVDVALRCVVIEKQVAARWVEEEGVCQEPVERATDEQLRSRQARSADTDVIELDETAPVTESRRSTMLESQGVEVSTAAKARRVPPMVTLIKSTRLLAALWGSIVLAIVLTAFDATLPLYVKATFEWSSTGAGTTPKSKFLCSVLTTATGLIFLTVVLPSFLGPVVGWASDHYGARWLATSGFLLITPVVVLLRLVTHNTIGQKILMSALLAMIGLAANLIATPIMADISHAVERKASKNPGIFGKKGAYAQVTNPLT